jgi:hypothetical protein
MMLRRGDGSHGILFMSQGRNTLGHYVAVRNEGGMIRYFDSRLSDFGAFPRSQVNQYLKLRYMDATNLSAPRPNFSMEQFHFGL